MLEIENFENIENLWKNKIRETVNLEFKSQVETNSNEMAKDISSFANSEGGIIVYGLEEDEQGLAQKSSGISIAKQDETIQQVVSTCISPPLQIRIQVINNSKNNKLVKGFIIVKIPKSELYIHQVNTVGKFYIRNNTVTSPFKYEALTLKESEISLLYEKRFQNKTRITNSFKNKESQYVSNSNASVYFMVGAIPQSVTIQGEKISRTFFNKLICTKEEGNSISSDQFYYNWFREHDLFFNNKPKGDGRTAESHGKLLEINDDGSAYFFQKVEAEEFWEWWWHLFAIIDFLHFLKRFYSKRNYFGGISITCKISYKFPLDNRGTVILSLDRHILSQDMHNDRTNQSTINGVEITEDIQMVPFKIEQHVLNIFEKIFETLGQDNPREQHASFVKKIQDTISKLEQINFD